MTTAIPSFIRNGNEYKLMPSGSLDIHEKLPAETFLVRFNSAFNFYYLELVTDMVVPTKLYGETEANVTRFLETFNRRNKNTGILLCGEKGSGKTMTMRALGLKAIPQGMPVLVINEQHAGETFNQFMAAITQKCVVCFDEFDKTYDDEHQQHILTLLDGVFNSNKLFVFTCNDSFKVNKHFLNRPGRMFYNIRFRGISEATINDYCADKLENKKNVKGIHEVAATVDAFNFDMLIGLVEEMNRYGETAMQAVKLMNIRPETSTYVSYTIEAMKGSVKWEAYHYNGANPLAVPRLSVDLSHETAEKDEDGDAKTDYARVTLTPGDLVTMDTKTGDIMMRKDGFNLRFMRQVTSDFNYDAF